GCLTPDADPQHLEAAESGLPPLLGRRAADEDLVDDDPGTGLRHCGDTRDPRRLQGAELRPYDDLTVRSELDPRRRRLHGHRHRLDQRVGPERQPGIRQDHLQAPGDTRLAGAGAAVEHDHLDWHGATVPALCRTVALDGVAGGLADVAAADRRGPNRRMSRPTGAQVGASLVLVGTGSGRGWITAGAAMPPAFESPAVPPRPRRQLRTGAMLLPSVDHPVSQKARR